MFLRLTLIAALTAGAAHAATFDPSRPAVGPAKSRRPRRSPTTAARRSPS
ncbi:hypothetical protein [Hankyongella ginsenosidimutans]|nr:hypothetical protein [Hankyongella ginsenosidimutans]